MSTVVGTPYYVAPEIINGHYGPECDIWSLGVILHVLLVGYPPFRGENKAEIFKKVLKAKYNLKEKEFDTVSAEAKDLIKKLLNPDAKKRITAADAMEEPWFNIMMHSANDRVLDNGIIGRLNSFKAISKLRVEVIKMMVQFLSESDIKSLKNTFRMLDKSHTGFISPNDLKAGLVTIGLESNSQNIHSNQYLDIISEADFDKNGQINYTEFIAATLDMRTIMKQENVWAAFKKFDIVCNMQDNKGFITRENLKKALEKTGIEISDQDVSEMMNGLKLKNLNQVDFKEFCLVLDCNSYAATHGFDIPPPVFEEQKKGK